MTTDYDIPFNRSTTLGKELQYIAETLSRGQIAGDQTFTRRCQALLERLTGARRVLLTVPNNRSSGGWSTTAATWSTGPRHRPACSNCSYTR